MTDTDIVPDEVESAEAQVFVLSAADRPQRLDKVLARLLPQHSRTRLQGWIEGGHVEVDGRPAHTRLRVGPGAQIRVWPQPAPEDLAFVGEQVEFRVVAESDDWIVVDKPAGLVTHPGAGNWHGTLLNGLLFRYPELARVPRAGIVHRLDKDTSGLLVVARTEVAQTNLVRQLQARTVRREYVALAHGSLTGEGVVDRPVGRDARVPVRMSVERPVAPRHAVTHYRAERHGLLDGQPVTQVSCRLETGRTHQIRVHLASLKHPLIGDVLYGGRLSAGVGRQMLHARVLAFQDPRSSVWLNWQAQPPADFQAACAGILWDDSELPG